MRKERYSFDPGMWCLKTYPGGDLSTITYTPNALGKVTEQAFSTHQFDYVFEEPFPFSSGEYAVKLGGTSTTRQNPDWLLSENFYKLFLTGCASLNLQDGQEIEMVVVIPIDGWHHRQAVKDRLTGEHSYKLRGKSTVTFTVTRTRVQRQCIASIFHALLTPAGKFIDFDRASRQSILCVNSGGRDMNTAVLTELDSQERYTTTHYNYGFWQVIYDVAGWLKREHHCHPNEMQLARICESDSPTLLWRNERIDLTEIVHDTTAYYGRLQADELSKYPLDTMDVMLVAGGSGIRFFPYYQELSKNFVLLENAQAADVVGALKFSYFGDHTNGDH